MTDLEVTYLTSLIPTRAEVDAFIEPGVGPTRPSRNGGIAHDPELGWLRVEAVRPEGVDGSKVFYSYEPDRARRVINCADRPCRIHTFGDSFTHCDQVSDGESWQEFLAAHLQEPVRNYGVGGFSVYQAYLRMKRVEARAPAPYLILNIYDHDHWRNLFNWWAINFGQRVECGFTCPHLRVNVEQNRVDERPNLLPRPEDVYKLCDRDWVIETFRDDPVLPVAVSRRNPQWATSKTVDRVAQNFGLSPSRIGAGQLSPFDTINRLADEAAQFATRYVVTQFRDHARCNGQQMLLVLSHPDIRLAEAMAGKPRWEQTFLEFLKRADFPVVDTYDAFAADCRALGADPDIYLKRYYNAHHSPAGNFFTAWALKGPVVDWLDPKPAPYAPGGVTAGTKVFQAYAKPRADIPKR